MKFKGSALFQLALMVLSLGMGIMGTQYNPQARLIPEILSIILFILASGLFLGDNIPFFQRRMRFIGDRGFFTQTGAPPASKPDAESTQQNVESDSPAEPPARESLKLIRQFGWLIVFVAALRFASYLIVVPIWLLLYIKFESGRKWRDAVYAAVGMGIFDYVLFALLLKATF